MAGKVVFHHDELIIGSSGLITGHPAEAHHLHEGSLVHTAQGNYCIYSYMPIDHYLSTHTCNDVVHQQHGRLLEVSIVVLQCCMCVKRH